MSDQRFNTGNPIGSDSPLDRSDNTRNFDVLENTRTLTEFPDRFGVPRKTRYGMEVEFDADQASRESQFSTAQSSREDQFNTFVASSGYQFVGDYAAGIEITQYNQLVRDENGEFWRVSGQVDLPYVTTGAGIPENDALVPAGDAVIRQDLANPDIGAAMVAWKSPLSSAVSRALSDKIGENVSVDDAGAIGDGVADDSDVINSAIASLSAIYMLTGRPQTLRFTAGKTYTLRMVMLRPGVNLYSDGGAILLKTPAGGETDESVLKWWRMAATATTEFNSDFACAHRIRVQGLIFDGNLENMNWTENTYSQEQAGCLFLTGPGAPTHVNMRTKFLVQDVVFRNSVADGLSINRDTDVHVFNPIADNCFRGGLVCTGGNTKLVVRNYIGENARVDLEVDGPGFGGSYKLDIDVDGLTIDRDGGGLRPGGIDLGGVAGGTLKVRNAQVFTAPFNYSSSGGADDRTIRDSMFTLGGMSAAGNRIFDPAGDFIEVRFVVKYEEGFDEYAALHVYPRNASSSLLHMLRCTFELHPSVRENNPDAVCYVMRLNAARSDTGVNNGVKYRLEDCRSVGEWDYEVSAVIGGTVEVIGGVHSADALFSITSGSDRPVQLLLSGNIQLEDSVQSLFHAPGQVAQANAYVQFLGCTLSRYVAAGSALGTYPVIGGYTFPVIAPPTTLSALRGARARLDMKGDAAAAVQEWTATTSHPSASQWRASAWEVRRGTTANRPLLTATDVGVQYMDITLAAAGKPIMWTGSSWVDLTGSVI